MKCKKPLEYAPFGPDHKYLGHFAEAKHINRGHNSNGIIELIRKGIEAVAEAVGDRKTTGPWPSGRKRDE